MILDKDKIYHKFNWQVEKYTLEGDLKDCWLTTMVSMTVNMMAMDAREGISAFLEKRKPNWKNK